MSLRVYVCSVSCAARSRKSAFACVWPEDVLTLVEDVCATRADVRCAWSSRGVVALWLNDGPHAVMRAQKDGETALHVAARIGHVAVVSALLSAGADLNVQDKVGDGASDCVVCAQPVAAVSREWL